MRIPTLVVVMLAAAGTARAQDTAQAPAPAPAPAPAQDTAGAIRPGMSEADVIGRWGAPMAVRRLNNWTYLFYENGTEAERGYSDCVFLQDGRVVDAIIRASGRMYLGQSSSPDGSIPEFTPPNRPAAEPANVAPVGGVRVNPPKPE